MKKYTYQKNKDGSWNIPNIDCSLRIDYANGKLTLEEVAKEFYLAGSTNYVDLNYAKNKMKTITITNCK